MNPIPAPQSPHRVLAVGAANMDVAGTTPHTLTRGDSTPGRIRHAPGGVARNVAENLARLGNPTTLVSAVGDDLFGRSVLAQTRAAGVNVDACWILAGQATSTYVSLHGPDGDMAAAINDMSILQCITPERLVLHTNLVSRAEVLMLDGNLGEAALAYLFGQARDTPVFVDPVSAFKCRRFLPWLGRVHTLKANRLEAGALCGRPVDTDAAVVAAASWLQAQGVRQVVLSLGERGVYWSGRDGPGAWQLPPRVQVVNTTGAGDALMAGLVHGHLHHMPLSQAVRFASGCAALTLTVAQANHPGLSVDAVATLCQKEADSQLTTSREAP